MTAQTFFCSNLSRAHSEALYGTAPRVDWWILLEYPGAWSSKALPDDRLPLAVQRRLRALVQNTPRARCLFIRQSHLAGEHITLFLVRNREHAPETFRLRLDRYEDLLDLDIEAVLAHPRALRWEVPLYLVCTHGKHDKCCAKFGLPLYKKLRHTVESQVWQCTHVGGDRFAGNVLCMPHGLYYGHVFPDDVPALIEKNKTGEILIGKYRGRSCYSKTAQIGEYFIRRRSGISAVEDLSFGDSRLIDSDKWRVRFGSLGTGSEYEVEFHTRSEGLVEYLTCHSNEPSTIARYEMTGYRVL